MKLKNSSIISFLFLIPTKFAIFARKNISVRPLDAPQVVKIEQLASFLGAQLPPSYQDIDEGSQFTLYLTEPSLEF